MPAALRTRTVRKEIYKKYLVKSEEFLRAANDSFRRGDYDACTSAAVHSAINAVDALTSFYLQMRHAGESHGDVMMLVRRVQLSPREIDRLTNHYSAMLKTKNIAEYEDRLLNGKEAEAVLKHLYRLRSMILSALPG